MLFSYFRVPWVCTKPTLTVLNICQYYRWYYTDLACHFAILWWRITHWTTLNQCNLCSSAFRELTTKRSREASHLAQSFTPVFLIMGSLILIERCRVEGLRVRQQFHHSLLLPFLNCWPRGLSARCQTVVCMESHRQTNLAHQFRTAFDAETS